VILIMHVIDDLLVWSCIPILYGRVPRI